MEQQIHNYAGSKVHVRKYLYTTIINIYPAQNIAKEIKH